MAMAQTAFRARPALYHSRTTVAKPDAKIEMPLFQAFLRSPRLKVTDGYCIKDTTTIDPSCGTGGFLITAMNHALKQLRVNETELWEDPNHPNPYELEEFFRKRTEYLSTCVFGIDINPSLVRAAKMNMVMNNDGSGGLYRENSLTNPNIWDNETRKYVKLDSFD